MRASTRHVLPSCLICGARFGLKNIYRLLCNDDATCERCGKLHRIVQRRSRPEYSNIWSIIAALIGVVIGSFFDGVGTLIAISLVLGTFLWFVLKRRLNGIQSIDQ